jgi:hypothetical protein
VRRGNTSTPKTVAPTMSSSGTDATDETDLTNSTVEKAFTSAPVMASSCPVGPGGAGPQRHAGHGAMTTTNPPGLLGGRR